MSRVLWSRLLLVVVCALSFGLVTTVNRAAGQLLSIAWIPDACIASTVVCLGLYLAIRPERPFGLPSERTDWRRVRRLGVTWLVAWLATVFLSPPSSVAWVRPDLGGALAGRVRDPHGLGPRRSPL
jgi:hypothetical protein